MTISTPRIPELTPQEAQLFAPYQKHYKERGDLDTFYRIVERARELSHEQGTQGIGFVHVREACRQILDPPPQLPPLLSSEPKSVSEVTPHHLQQAGLGEYAKQFPQKASALYLSAVEKAQGSPVQSHHISWARDEMMRKDPSKQR